MSRRRAVLLHLVHDAAALGIVLGLWQVLTAGSSSPFLATPRETIDRLQEWADAGELIPALVSTGTVVTVGFTIGAMAGVGLACAMYWMPRANSILEPYVMALYAMPKTAVVPLLFLWLGRGGGVQLLFVTIGTFTIIFASVTSGIRTIDREKLMVLEGLGASRAQLAKLVILPHSVGYLIVATTIAAPFALLAAIVVEMLQGTGGVGGALVVAAGYYDAAGVFAATVMAAGLGVLVSGGAALIAGRWAHWRDA